jgi:hypothetical protein
MKKRSAILALLIAAPLVAGAQTITTFTPNTTISASQMNDNFAALKDAIVALTTRVAALETKVTALETQVANNKVSGDATNGYATFDGGLILEWGTVTASSY